ncbi:MATE family efflux transporter [Clostridium sp.]|uniref:MATE family efflux transporter n=1 Tax=Clostridium sp. TaxID=1506 RepID=UPI00346490D5
MSQNKTQDKGLQDKLLKGNVGKLLIKLSLPCIAAQLVNAIYNIVDRMYIGHIEGIGATALTSLGIAFPITLIIAAFSALVGSGGAPIASIRLGEKKKDEAEELLGNSLSLLIIFGVILTILTLIFKEKLLYMFGATENTFQYANEYLTIYSLGTIFVMISVGLNYFINSQGFTTMGMFTILIGAVLNILLDPLFIYGLDMGVKGAALATILSQGISAIWTFIFLKGETTIIKIKFKYLKLKLKTVKQILSLGSSSFTIQITNSLVQVTANSTLLKYGGDMYIGSMTILSSLMQVFFMPIIGVTQGAQPIIGYNYGAKHYSRVKEAIKASITFCFTLSAIFWLLSMFAPTLLIKVFSSDAQLIDLALSQIRTYMFMMFMLGIQAACQNFFTAIGKANIAIFLAMLRKVILLVPLMIILPRLYDLGAYGVILAEPIADGLATSVTIIMFIIQIRILNSLPEKPLEEGLI